MINNWSIPDKVEDLYPKRALKLEKSRRTLVDYFLKNKFELINPSMIEFANNVSFTGESVDSDMFKILDPLTGKIIGITPDLTIQTARIDNYLSTSATDIRRYCYCSSVLKTNTKLFNQSREELQVGVEIYGNEKIEADIDVVNTLIKSFKLLKLNDILLSFTDISIYTEFLNSLGLSDLDSPQLRALFAKKDTVSIIETLQQNLTKVKIDKIKKYLTIYGDKNALKELAELFKENFKVTNRIKNINNIVKSLPSGTNYIIDVSDVDCYEYHSGLIFSAYSPKYTSPLAKGGRFENLTSNFGKKRPAVGFTFDLRRLLFIG
ncbi:MAG: ATP phosphoribosyltransferase regulatory subunit [Proteobacteria bacterium]|nr:ATP phosphoribosyltransferase regulatory subunit [Pseudomonadota bacterium]